MTERRLAALPGAGSRGAASTWPTWLAIELLVVGLALAIAAPARADVTDASFEVKVIRRSWVGVWIGKQQYGGAFEAEQAIRAALNWNVMRVGGVVLSAQAHLTRLRQETRVPINTSGKLLLCLDMDRPWQREGATVDVVEDPEKKGEHLVLLEVPARGLSLTNADKPDEIKAQLSEMLEEPCRQMRQVFAEIATVACYRFRFVNERDWESRLKSRRFYASGDPASALKLGLDLAREIYWLADEVHQGTDAALFEGRSWYHKYRLALPRTRQVMCYMLRLASQMAGAAQLRNHGWAGSITRAEGIVDPDEWYHPVFELPEGGGPLFARRPVLRSAEGMDGCEAMVALVLMSLFDRDSYSSRPIRAAMENGAGSLSAVLRVLTDGEKDAKRKDALRWTVGQRTLGVYVNAAQARELVARRIADQISMKRFDTDLTALIQGSGQAPRVYAGGLKDEPLGSRYDEPAERIRNLLDHFGRAEAHMVEGEVESAYAIGTYAIQLIEGKQPPSALASLAETEHYLAEGAWWEAITLHTELHGMLDLNHFLKANHPPAANGRGSHGSSSHGGLAGGLLKAWVAGALTHHLLHQDYEFMKCDQLTGTEKAQRLALTLADFSHWTIGAGIEISVSAAIFALVTKAVPKLKGGILGTIAVATFEELIWPLLEKAYTDWRRDVKRETLREGLRDWMRAYVTPACEPGSKGMDIVVRPPMRNATDGPSWTGPIGITPEDHRRFAREHWGRLREHVEKRFVCGKGDVEERVSTLSEGWFGEWTAVCNAQLSEQVHHLHELQEHAMEPLVELQEKYAHAVNPFRGTTRLSDWKQSGGLMTDAVMRNMAIYRFAVDGAGNVRRPEEIADRMIHVIVATPLLNRKIGGNVKAEDADALNRFHRNLLGFIRGELDGRGIQEIREKHASNLADLGEEVEDLLREERSIRAGVIAKLRDEGVQKVRAIQAQIVGELNDLLAFQLQRVADYHQGKPPIEPAAQAALDKILARQRTLHERMLAYQRLLTTWQNDRAFEEGAETPTFRMPTE